MVRKIGKAFELGRGNNPRSIPKIGSSLDEIRDFLASKHGLNVTTENILKALGALPDREKQIIKLRCGIPFANFDDKPKTLVVIGAILISRQKELGD